MKTRITAKEMQAKLEQLIAEWEHETVEFKSNLDGNTKQQVHKIGQYISALSNEANLAGLDCGWFIMGVHPKTHQIIGTDFLVDKPNFDIIKQQVHHMTDGQLTLKEIHELFDSEDRRVLMIRIPAAPRGIPIACNGHRYQRSGENLIALTFESEDVIRSQSQGQDWTAKVAEGATVADLDIEAIGVARSGFAKNTNKLTVDEVNALSVSTLLKKLDLMLPNGKLTKAAVILLGKSESISFLSPNPARITWILKDKQKVVRHFTIPFILTTTDVYNTIRNYSYKITPVNTLIPIEIWKYSKWNVTELLHNCIMHQDYRTNGRIVLTEMDDRLVFQNDGGFYEGTLKDYVIDEQTPKHYRNPLLASAMVKTGMVDSAGIGIHKVFTNQIDTYLPLPDYDVSSTSEVTVTLYGEPIDEAFSQILVKKLDLPIELIFGLDSVQKGREITDELAKQLKKYKLIEGRKPKYIVSKSIAALTESEAKYISQKGHGNEYYKKLIIDFLSEFGKANRKQLNELLMNKLPEVLSDEQKSRKISKLLTQLKVDNVIHNAGSRTDSNWVLFPDDVN